jgi:hypothetical protein
MREWKADRLSRGRQFGAMSKGREGVGGGVQWARGQCGDRYGERLGRAGQDDGAGSHTYEVHPSVEYARF